MKTLQLFSNPFVHSTTVSKNINFDHANSLTTNPFLVQRRRFMVPPIAAAAPQNRQPRDPKLVSGANKKEEKMVLEGVITESLPNGMFRVRLENNNEEVLGYISGRIRKNFIRILPGDKVKMEVDRYDTSKGRIIYRN